MAPLPFERFRTYPAILTGASLLLYSSTNSSLALFGPRNLNSLMKTGLPEPEPPDVCAVPVRDTTAEPPELPMLSVAAFAAGCGAVGWKVTETVVAPPATRVVTPGAPTENWSAFAPPSVNGVVSVTVDALLFVMVMFLNADPPTSTGPKSNVVGDAAIDDPPLPVMSARERGNSWYPLSNGELLSN